MKFKSISVLFCVSLTLNAFCQESYFQGSYTNIDGEIISGLISDRQSPKDISFKGEKNNKIQIKSAFEVAEYTLKKSKFISRKIIRTEFYKTENILSKITSINPTSPVLTKFNTETALFKDETSLVDTSYFFLEYLIEGPVSLFRLSADDEFPRYYLEALDKQFLEIPPKFSVLDTTERTKEHIRRYPNYQRSDLSFSINDDYSFITVINDVLDLGQSVDSSSFFDYDLEVIKEKVFDFNRKQGVENGGIAYESLSEKPYFGLNLSLNPLVNQKLSGFMAGVYMYKNLQGEFRRSILRLGLEIYPLTIPEENSFSFPQDESVSVYRLDLAVINPLSKKRFQPYLGVSVGLDVASDFWFAEWQYSVNALMGATFPIKNKQLSIDAKISGTVNKLINRTFFPVGLTYYF